MSRWSTNWVKTRRRAESVGLKPKRTRTPSRISSRLSRSPGRDRMKSSTAWAVTSALPKGTGAVPNSKSDIHPLASAVPSTPPFMPLPTTWR